MAFTKITNSELNSRGATTLPNQPTISAAALKQEFDAPAKEIVAPKFNNLIDELEAETAAANIGIETPTGRIGETIQEVLNDVSTDLENVENAIGNINHSELEDAVAKRHSHENKNVLDEFSVSEHGNLLWDDIPVGGGGSDYENLENLPQINGHQLIGNKSDNDLDLASASSVDSLASSVGSMASDLGIAQSRIRNLQEVTTQLSNDKADKSDLGTASAKNSTSVVTDSTDLVESGAVYDVIGFGSTNLIDVSKYTVNGVVVTEETEGTKAVANNTSIANPAVNFRDNTSGMQEYVPVGKYILSFDVVDCEVLPTTQLAFRNSTNQIVKSVYITGVGHYEIKYTTLVPTKISLLLRVGTTGATGNEFVTFKNLTLLGSLDDRKADNSVIGTVEGANASKAWSAGEHFIKDGAFKEVTAPIASGEAINSGNTTDKPIADCLVYKAGDSVVLSASNNQIPYSGYITASSVWIRFFIPLNKKCVGISNVTFSNTTKLFVRGINGYLVNDLLLSSFTISIDQITDNGIYLQFSKSDGTAFDVTNNTPISVALSNASITFS